MNDAQGKRHYDNRLRAQQAAETRHRILETARAEFLGRGYAATSMSGVARSAGVSRETVYKMFGSKPALLKDVYDVALAGDEEALSIAERPLYRDILDEPVARRKLALLATASADLMGRLGPVIGMIAAGARAGDPDLVALAETSKAERLAGVAGLVSNLAAADGLRAGLSVERAVDQMWMLLSPEVAQLLLDDRGWTLAEYGEWLDGALADALLRR